MNGVASDKMVRSTPSRAIRSICLFISKNVVLSPKCTPPDVEIDRVAFAAFYFNGKLVARLGEPEEVFRHEVTMHIGNHTRAPGKRF